MIAPKRMPTLSRSRIERTCHMSHAATTIPMIRIVAVATRTRYGCVDKGVLPRGPLIPVHHVMAPGPGAGNDRLGRSVDIRIGVAGPCQNILTNLLVAGAAHERIGRVLAGLHAWLPERVYMIQRASHHGLELHHIEEFADDPGVDRRDMDGQVGSLCLGQRPCGCETLTREQLAELG